MKKIINTLLFLCLLTTFGLQTSFAETYPELCEVFNRTLKPGDTGQDVKRLQVVLGQEGIAYLASTGYFGPATERAVKVFQQRNGIYPAGKVGPQTFRFMKNMWCLGTVPLPSGNLNPNNVYIPINTANPEVWRGVPEVSIRPVSSNANSVTIAWNTTGVNTCTLYKNNSGLSQPILPSGQQVFDLFGETNFTIKCMGNNGREYSKTIVVRPNQPIYNLPWVNVTISPAQVLVGTQATLYWTSQNTSYCTSNVSGYNSNLLSSGSIPVTISSANQVYTFTCYSATGQSVSQTITANSNQISVPTINNFTYSNNYLAWGTSNTNSCSLSGTNLSNPTVQTNGNLYVPTPSTNTTWTLTCYGNTNQSVTRQVNYSIYTTTPTPTGTITADANTDAQSYRNQVGQVINFYCPANLAFGSVWGTDTYSDDSSVCTAAVHAGKISQATGGNVSITMAGAQNTFTATTRNNVTSVSYGYWPGSFTFVGGTSSGNMSVNFTASQTSVNSGQPVTLSWSSTNASYCTPIVGSERYSPNQHLPSDSITVYPVSTVIYYVICYNGSGQSVNSSPITIGVYTNNTTTVNATLSASQTSITSGQSINLNWTSQNASSCSVIGGTVNATNQSTTGNIYNVYPTVTTTYTLTCYGNNSQSNSNSITIYVNNSSTQAPTVNISASPNPMQQGQITNLSWYSSNANYCNIVGGNTNLSNQPANGSYAVSPSISTNYTITCYNNNGQNASAYVYVTTTGGGGANNGGMSLISNYNKYVTVQVNNSSCLAAWYINWGDGQTSQVPSQCGNINISHQYTYSGTFNAVLWMSGGASSNLQIFVQ